MTNKQIYIERNKEVLEIIASVNSVNLYQAKSKLKTILLSEPNNNFIRINIANLSFMLGEFDESKKYLDQFMDSDDPRYLDFYMEAISIYTRLSRFKEATFLARKMISYFPDHLESWWSLAETAFDARSIDEGEYAALEFLKRAPEHVEMRVYLANLLSGKGEFERAEILYREAISLHPSHSIALYGLSRCKKFSKDSLETIGLTKKALAHLSEKRRKIGTSEDSARILLAQAKLFNDVGDFDRAWNSASLAKKELHESFPFDSGEFERFTDELIDTFKDYDFSSKSSGPSKEAPILIVGMPRSGTTLVEQILSMDNSVYAGGEKQGFDYSIVKTFGNGDYLHHFFESDDDSIVQMAESYQSYYHQFENFSGTRVVDKVPRNYLHLGIFKKIFPDIKVINMVRDSLDNATSIYFEHFSKRINYTNNIEDILFARREYEKLMSFWQEKFPSNILTINYEELVQDFEFWRNRIVEFCELNISIDSNYEDSKNSVETPSVWQVRQGINSNSVGRWKRYEKYLGEYINSED